MLELPFPIVIAAWQRCPQRLYVQQRIQRPQWRYVHPVRRRRVQNINGKCLMLAVRRRRVHDISGKYHMSELFGDSGPILPCWIYLYRGIRL